MGRRTAAFALLVLMIGSAFAGGRPLGDSRVVAQLPPAPGYPEGIAVHGSRIYVATAARFGTAFIPPPGPPEIQVFDAASGALEKRIAIATKDPTMDHGTSGLAFDAAGRLYVLDTQWGVVRFDPATAATTLNPGTEPSLLYATAFPNIPPCSPLTPTPCSPTLADAPSLPNDIAFAADGTAYVSDSLQATIWHIPPGGGAPAIWFQDPRLGGGFGVNGLRLDPARTALVVSVTADGAAKGVIYRIPIGAKDTMTALHTYDLAEAPDNLAFGQSGKLYVALAGSNQISVLEPSGKEYARFGGPAQRPDGTDVLWDMPSGVAFHPSNGALLVNNHSEILGLPMHFVVFDVFVHDTPDPLELPVLP